MTKKISEIAYDAYYYMPLVSLIIAILIPTQFLNFYRIIFIYIFIHIHVECMKKKKTLSCILVDLFVVFSVFYILKSGNGLYYLLDSDVFGFWMLIYIIYGFSNKEIVNALRQRIEANKTVAMITCTVTIITSILSVIQGVGFVSAHGTTVFTGYYSLEHELAYHCIIMYCLAGLYEKRITSKYIYVFKVSAVIIILLTGVRSAFFSICVLIVLDLLKQNLSKKIAVMLLAILCGVVLFVGNPKMLSNIPIFSKTEIASSHTGDATNGRGKLSKAGIDYYLNNMRPREKALGITMTRLRTDIYHGMYHAHNDVLNILIGYGYVYLFIFCLLFLKYCKTKNGLYLFFSLFLLIYFNGLFMYLEMVCALPLIKIFVSEDSIRKG